MIGVVMSCEHAAWRLPPGLDLGVPEAIVQSQAGWDHGALEIAADVSRAARVTVHAGRFTRMFVDLNRAATHPDVIPRVSYGAPVPGNASLSEGDRAARLAQHHAPYWAAVRADVTARLAATGRCLHLSSHSFDPALDPVRRTFDVGVLYDPGHAFEAELAESLLRALASGGLDVRANQPYSGVGPAICTSLREALAGERYAGIELETSHALTITPGGCARVAAAIRPWLAALVG